MNLSSIQATLYERLRYQSTPAAAVVTRLTRYVNEIHREIVGQRAMSRLRDATFTFPSVNAQSAYGLPPNIARINQMFDITNKVRLTEKPLRWLRAVDPGMAAIGGPSYYFINTGFQAVAKQPAATGVWAVSTSASDTSPTVTVEAFRTGGYLDQPSAVTLNGLTRVEVGSNTDYVEVIKFEVSTACVGQIVLYDASTSGNELARIGVGQTYSRYLGVTLFPQPSSVITYSVDYTRNIPDLAAPTDEPLLPTDFHWVLVRGALAREYDYQQDSRYNNTQNEYKAGIVELRAFVQTDGADVISLRLPRPRFSQLGPNFPAGS
jgi:hypothetical protein